MGESPSPQETVRPVDLVIGRPSDQPGRGGQLLVYDWLVGGRTTRDQESMDVNRRDFMRAAGDARRVVVVENKMVQGEPVGGEKPEPGGRMVRSRRFKYCAYDSGTRREALADLERDPGELVNLAGDPAHRAILLEHRRYLAEWCRTTRDPFTVPG